MFGSFLFILGLASADLAIQQLAAQERQNFISRDTVEKSFSKQPTSDLAYDWVVCLEGSQLRNGNSKTRFECDSWTTQGVTSTLIALEIGGERIPVVESTIADAVSNGRIVIHLEGGPGGMPFHTDRTMTDAIVAQKRKIPFGMIDGRTRMPLVSEMGEYELLKRGFTIVSIAYWGTRVRTLEEVGEFALAKDEVRSVIDHYRQYTGDQPALVTNSLGNHLALAALGKEQIEASRILALVPVMDGLQHHLTRALAVLEDQIEKAESEGKLGGDWGTFNVFKRTEGKPSFDHSRMLAVHEYAARYLLEADYPWKGINLKGKCATIVLGRKDPRTRDYVDVSADLPPFVQVWDTNHYLLPEAPEKTRQLFADFGDCLLAEKP
jgi:hypothetical protein